MDRATSARPPTGPAPTRRPRLVTVDEAIAFAFRQVFLAGYFTDRSVPERAVWRHALVVGWAIRDAVYTALWTAAANWDWAFPHVLRWLVPETWAKRASLQEGAFALRLASGLLATETGVAPRTAACMGYVAAWVANLAGLPSRTLAGQ